jgi:hypothetical protein
MNHVAIASAIPFLVALAVFLRHRRAGIPWLLLTPLAMAFCSLWAVVPDIPRLWGDKQLYMQISCDPRSNIFFFHHSIDQWESDSPWWGAVVVLAAGLLLLVAWRELRIVEEEQGRTS